MTRTPDEARTKVCYRTMQLAQPRHCIADDCQAWRWHLSPKRIAIAQALVAAGDHVSAIEHHMANSAPYGYCGPAGAIGLD